MIILKFVLIFCSLGGFLLSLYIFHKKHSHEKMLCPVGGKCEAVIASEYARFFGIPLEIIGLFYYGIIFIAYTILFVAPWDGLLLVKFLLFWLTITAFLFSAYLTFIQAFTLKAWCSLCLTSAALCTVILTSALLTSEQSFISLLALYQPLVSSFYVLALAIGIGCATITDIFFLKFLKDYRISESEYDVLATLSQIMWAALSVIVVSAVALALGAYGGFGAFYSPSLIASWAVLGVIIVNTAVLNLVVAPKLLHISFREKHNHEPGELRSIHKLAFETGGISLVSWYAAFMLTIIPAASGLSLPLLLLGYFFILICGIAAGRAIEYFLRRSSRTAA